MIVGIPVVAHAPVANADDAVVYEVRSSAVDAVANIENADIAGPHALQNVTLPWRTTASVVNPHSDDAQLAADWRQEAQRYKWVTVRTYTHGSLLCEFTLDSGNAACSGRGAYADERIPR